MIIYESPHKIQKLIEEFNKVLDKDRRISISRELTKVYEETMRGSISEISNLFSMHKSLKGEFVVVIEGKKC